MLNNSPFSLIILTTIILSGVGGVQETLAGNGCILTLIVAMVSEVDTYV